MKTPYFKQSFLIVLFATLIFIGFKNCLPARIFPETKASGSNVVVDSLMLEAISGKEIDKVLSQANDSLAQEQRLKKSDQYLFSFFKKLEELEQTKNGKIRIAYYGDSMTDGDLIVQDLRALFQNAFGGLGIGFLPIASESAKSRGSVFHSYSNTWKTQSYVNVKRPKRPFGVSGQVFFTQGNGTWVQYRSSNQAHISQLYAPALFYGASGNKEAKVEIAYNDTVRVVKSLDTDKLLNVLPLTEGANTKSVRITFYKSDSIPIYGVGSMQGKGVYIDNFSSRGNSGLPLSLFNPDLMRAFDRALGGYDLVVLHFGANVLNYGTLDYSWYERGMTKVINQIRACFPHTSILVISTADKSTKVDMEMQTDKAVVPLANAQRKYAQDTRSGFINLYELMGGRGSMKQWVEANPPLAGKDYTHFNPRGAKKVAHLIYNKLMEEYEHYKDPRNSEKADVFQERIKEIQTVRTVTPTTQPNVNRTRTQTVTTQRVQSPTTQRVQSATTQRVQSTTTQRVQSATIQRVQSTTTQRVQSTTTQRVQSPTTQRVQSATTQRVQSATTQRVQSPTTQRVQPSTIQAVQNITSKVHKDTIKEKKDNLHR